MKSDEITVERLRKALGEVVLKPKWQPPSDEALNALAAYLRSCGRRSPKT